MRALALLVSLCASLAALPVSGRSSAPAQPGPIQISGFYLPQPLSLQSFSLLDHRGEPFEIDDLRHRWTLVFFGYTHCPDVCPTTLAQIRSVKSLLAARDPSLQLSVVFVSIDPQRDTSAQLQQYVEQFGQDFTGVGGAPAEVDSFARQFKVKYAISGGTSTTYFLDHTSSVALLTPGAQLRALFSVPLRPESVAADLQRIARAEGPPAKTADVRKTSASAQ